MRSLLLAPALVLSAAVAANAGGMVAPTIDAEPVVASVAQPAPSWEGAYIGAALGYAFNGDDRIGRRDAETGALTDIGNADVHGGNLSLRAGYRVQRDRWVVGPELSYTAGSIKDGFDFAGGEFESKVNSELSLRLKTGYLVRDDMMVYGIAGVTRGDFTYTEDGQDVDYDASGLMMGLGVEKQINARTSITGELEHSYFDKTDIDLPSGYLSEATPTHSNVKLGLNFKF